MKSRLSHIKDWAELALAAKYRTSVLAKQCGVSTRELERYFLAETGKRPHERLNELRQVQGRSLLSRGKSVKEAAFELGYKHPAHFTRDFKQFNGAPPGSLRKRPPK
jgi:transcriptional regulator GlxA family with amidase domain